MTNITESTYYKIFLKSDPTQFYIGSTYKFSSRKSHHKKNVTNKRGKLYWTKLYKFIRDNGGWLNFEIEILYKSKVENKDQRLIEEQTIITVMNPPLNTNRACKKPSDYIYDIDKVINNLNLSDNKNSINDS